MEIVYILIWSEQGGGMSIQGVFSTEGLAKGYLTEFISKNKHAYRDDYSIIPMGLNPDVL